MRRAILQSKRMLTSSMMASSCFANKQQFRGHATNGAGGAEQQEELWTREGWVQSLPRDANRAPLDGIAPLLSIGFTPGELTAPELKVYNGAHNMVAKAEKDRQDAAKKAAEGGGETPQSEEQKFVENSPLSTYTKYYQDHHDAVELASETIRERVKGWDEKKKVQFATIGRDLQKGHVVVRTLAELYPKLWADFLKCEGKLDWLPDGFDPEKAPLEQQSLYNVCKYFQEQVPEDLKVKQEDGSTGITLPQHALQTYWEIENIINDGNLFLASRTAETSVNVLGGIVDDLYEDLKKNNKTSPAEFKILDAGCGAGNLGHRLQNALETWSLLKTSKETNRPEFSLYGFDCCLQVCSFLSASVQRNQPIPGFNLYNKGVDGVEPLLCIDPVADRDAFYQAYKKESFDLVLAGDFLLQDPTANMPGMSTLYDCFDLVKPGGSLVILNSLTTTSPAVLAAYSAALSAGRDGTGKDRLVEKLAASHCNVHKAPPASTTPVNPSKLDELLEKQRQVPVFVHMFQKKQ